MRLFLSATALAFLAPSLILSPVSGQAHHGLKSESVLGNPTDLSTKIMNTLYTNVLDPLTYVPPDATGMQPVVNTKTEYMQLLTQGYPLNAKDFSDLWANGNVNGNQTKTEYFTSTVDGGLGSTYGDSLRTFTPASDGKDTDKEADRQKGLLQKAQDLLYTWVDVKDLVGQVSQQQQKTPIYIAYLKKKAAYNKAVTAFRTTFLDYDMNDKMQQRKWQAQRPSLESEVDAALDDYRSIAPLVEQALTIINTYSTTTLSASMIESAKTDYANTVMGSALHSKMTWHPTFPQPYDFATDDSGFTELTISSSRLSQTSSQEFQQWGGGGSWSYGLWSVGGGASGSDKESRSHTENTDITMKFKFGLVRLERSWFHPDLFQIGGWYVNGGNKGVISDGTNPRDNKGIIPSYRTAMIVAKDLTITGDFSSKDIEIIEQIRQGSTRVGFGPFSVGGSYSSQSGSQKLDVSVDKNSIRVPGMQIIGWINSFVPLAPQMDDPKLH